ncbi:hypothetical protein [uncultured Gammaproteobacteria bacterium]|nr:hypothetical protein [uncultured Gammaproteobacteria bacterium]
MAKWVVLVCLGWVFKGRLNITFYIFYYFLMIGKALIV